MVLSSSLIPRPTILVILILSLITGRIMKIRHFQLPGFMSDAFVLPAAGIFLLCFYNTGCREAIHDEFLLAEPCKCVTVIDVLKYLAADKCNK